MFQVITCAVQRDNVWKRRFPKASTRSSAGQERNKPVVLRRLTKGIFFSPQKAD